MFHTAKGTLLTTADLIELFFKYYLNTTFISVYSIKPTVICVKWLLLFKLNFVAPLLNAFGVYNCSSLVAYRNSSTTVNNF